MTSKGDEMSEVALKKGDVVTKTKGKRKGKLGRVEKDTFNDFALITWQNGYPSLDKIVNLVKVEGEEFRFDDGVLL